MMTEEETKQEEQEETDPIKRAEAAGKLMQEQNDRAEAILQEMKTLEARRLLGGKSNAAEQEGENKEETPKEYKDRIMRGG